MNDEVIIRVENLGKRYSLRHQRDQRYVALRDVIAEKAKSLFRYNSDHGSRAGSASPGSALPVRRRRNSS